MDVVVGVARRVRYAASLLGWTVVATSAGAAIGLAALGAVARAYAAWLGDAAAGTIIGGWSFSAGYALLGLVAGGMIGLTFGIGRGLTRVLEDLRPALQAESTRQAAEGGLRMGTDELRRRWEHVADEAISRSIGSLRLPGARLVARSVSARLRHGVVDDFLVACEREGVTSVGPREIGRWIAAQGPAYLLAPVYVQLRAWRLVGSAVLVVAAMAPLLIALRG